MLPLVEVPISIEAELAAYRTIFHRDQGFAHISRYVTGLLLCDNKTLQGIHSQWLFPPEATVGRRAMHEAVFEANWSHDQLMQIHRQEVSRHYQSRGTAVISLDWTLSHHDGSEQIFGAKRGYDYVNNCPSCYQTVLTAAVSNAEAVDGLMVEVQTPNHQKEELAYLEMTAQGSYEEMSQVRERLEELLHYHRNRLAYRKRTDIFVAIVAQIEAEGNYPQANYAFDNGVLSLPLTQQIESAGKHWVSEIERSRLINWEGTWSGAQLASTRQLESAQEARVEKIAERLRQEHPESFRYVEVEGRNGETSKKWAFTKTVRLKKYGKKRLAIVHEQEDLSDEPRFLLTDAKHWESVRIIRTWSYRWPIEVFHEFSKQITGFESAQVRKEEAVKRHFCLSCVAQSILQRVVGRGEKSERFKFAKNRQTIGQKLYSLNREALLSLLRWSERLFAGGQSAVELLELAMPA